MAPVYLYDLHQLLEQQLQEIEEALARLVQDGSAEKSFLQGRLEAVQEIKAYLHGQYDNKMPRRIRNKMRAAQAQGNSKI